jgi:protein SCO1/2
VNKPLIIITSLAIVLGFASALFLLKPKPVQLQAVTWLGEQAKPLPVFELIDHNNKPFNNETIKGKWQLMFFGYTNCPDICPDTLTMLVNMVDQIKDEKVLEQLQITFISVDPERDSMEKMKAYVTYFNKDFMSARAEIDSVNTLTDATGILHYIVKSKDEDVYEVAHSGSLILVDPQSRFTGVFSSPHDSSKIAHDLTALINS